MANSNSSFGVSNPVINQSPQLTVDFVVDYLKSKGAPDEVRAGITTTKAFYNGFGWRIKTEDTNRLVD